MQVPEDRERGCWRDVRPGHKQHIRLWDGKADRVGAGNNCGFRYRFVLQQNTFKFERTDPVIGGFENVVGAADKRQVALLIGKHHVAAAI